MIQMAWMLLLVAGHVSQGGDAPVAITEFLNNPDGADKGREWVELFNYGADTVDLGGWTLGDEGTDLVDLPDIALPSGGFVVLVSGGLGGVDAATAKAIFETEWLAGRSDPAVVGLAGMALANGADELVLRDAAGTAVWTLAYADDETPPHATFLTATHDYSIRRFGSAQAPGVVRHGDDNDLPGFAGYEENDLAVDPFAVESDISRLAPLFGDDFASVVRPSVGSPLAGGNRVIPAGDVDRDGAVGVLDLLLLLGAFGPCRQPCPPYCPADFDGDCEVTADDLEILLAGWDRDASDAAPRSRRSSRRPRPTLSRRP